MEEAANLLACLASQPEPWEWFGRPMTLPGRWSLAAASLAAATLNERDYIVLDWRETYAEAEAHLRRQLDSDGWTRIPDPTCDLCTNRARWSHPAGGLRCGRCPRPSK